ncbi:DNA mismatch repair endonuclease MutL [Cetobacterium sp. 8H]|uniref:DNA mismatch repair endonuclease MutL n=1 Tax=Cetobacterium sp. 8H TaxID=2759681 RepID=UPI00163C5780|nr:DNA mismatch repair endonuclease MutL [Cetobacterium sp. 8H]MBC2850526.1 DNA mismatch repair endonuclease MutL [Cetobacterium sp. 8H]
MGVIKILDETLSNMIAAGEVVENPASLVKELLENSLDANSNYIKIAIKDGGKNLKFIDDGKGMSREDLLLCIERHATSKISSKDDLFNLCTYGFRGEALSSISAVSKMTISTKRKEDSIGYFINVSAGKITNLKEVQKSNGTEIEIKDLFFNTPARLKFLRKDSTENIRIKEIVLQEALANPTVSIILTIDGKEAIRTSGNGIENTILELFGVSILKNLKKLSFGYVGNLSLTRSSKDSIFTFVNGRPVKAKIMEEAIIDGFYTKLMKGKYPFAIIDFKIDPKTIDVNVHPSKKIIKFSDENKIYHKIYDEIIVSLNDDKNFTTGIIEVKREPSNFEFLERKEKKNLEILKINDIKIDKKIIANENIDNSKSKEEISNSLEINSQPRANQTNFIDIDNRFKPISTESKKIELLIETPRPVKELEDSDVFEPTQNIEIKKIDPISPFKVIGQFSNTFILVEENQELIIYDQHIVHERILYEKLKEQYQNQKISSQHLLVPIKVSLSSKECELLKEKINYFEDFGFEIDAFNDNDFLIRSVPNLSIKDSFENVFFEILEGLKKVKSKNEVIENMIISMSCKGAIKANEKLSIYEMEKLIKELHEIGEFTCPHGRPITFKVSLLDMEKGFKRK